MILQLIQLLQHLLIHLIDLSHNLIPHTSLVHQVRDVVPKVQSNQSLLYHLQNPHLEAMTRGKRLTVIAWPWNCWKPFSIELSQWWFGSPFFSVPYTNTRNLFWLIFKSLKQTMVLWGSLVFLFPECLLFKDSVAAICIFFRLLC